MVARAVWSMFESEHVDRVGGNVVQAFFVGSRCWSFHRGDPGGVPQRDIPVEARGALKHYGKATKGLRTSASPQHDRC